MQSSVVVVKLMSDASDVPTGYGSGNYRSAAGPALTPPPGGRFIILRAASGKNCESWITFARVKAKNVGGIF